MFHFLCFSNGPMSILSVFVIHFFFTPNHFCGVFWKIKNSCERCLRNVTEKTSFLRYSWDVLKMSHKRHLIWDVFEMSQRHHKKVISFEMFLRGLWDVSLKWDLIEISQRHLMPIEETLVKQNQIYRCRRYYIDRNC